MEPPEIPFHAKVVPRKAAHKKQIIAPIIELDEIRIFQALIAIGNGVNEGERQQSQTPLVPWKSNKYNFYTTFPTKNFAENLPRPTYDAYVSLVPLESCKKKKKKKKTRYFHITRHNFERKCITD